MKTEFLETDIDTQDVPANEGSGLSLSGLLRGLGSLVVVVAFSVFLFQRWEDGNDLTRYFLLLGHTVLLTLAGFASGHYMHEAKGARLFIALALAAVSVNFVILGGITYDYFTWERESIMLPKFADWQAGSASTAVTVAAVAMVPLAISAWVGFMVLARRSALYLTLIYLLGNGAVLLPVRDPNVTGGLLAALGLTVSVLAVQLGRRDTTLATHEGVFARAVLALPLILIGGRSLWLYSPGPILFTALGFIAYLAVRQIRSAVTDLPGWQPPLELLAGAIALGIGAGLFLVALDTPWLGNTLAVPAAGLGCAALMMDQSFQSSERVHFYRSLAGLSALGSLGFNLVMHGGFANAIACLLLGIPVLAYGYGTRERSVFIVGAFGTVGGLGYAVAESVQVFSLGGWSILALLGVATIVAGSVLDRHSERIKLLLTGWRQRFET